MDPNEIINNALAGNTINGEGLFILEGNPAKNELRILQVEDACTMNLQAFVWNINSGYQFMGLFHTEKQAQRAIDIIRMKLRNEEGERLL